MRRLRFYQLSLRRLFLLTALIAGGLWIALWWVGRITPDQGETLVTAREQRILRVLRTNFGLDFPRRNVFT
jgi:hypothetical protein